MYDILISGDWWSIRVITDIDIVPLDKTHSQRTEFLLTTIPDL